MQRAKKEKKITMGQRWGEKSSDEKEEENRRQEMERKRESVGNDKRKKDDDKRGRARGGHADEGKGGGGEGGEGGERRGRVEVRREAKRGIRESIEVYEKTIELICKQ